ncbi:hypothetical protein D5086_017623 [Populus alba]|uniref:Uncharacterized protein n=1 Tax=Populus alba TaxID=43335 RepID=A0ACC4BMF8_POPAL
MNYSEYKSYCTPLASKEIFLEISISAHDLTFTIYVKSLRAFIVVLVRDLVCMGFIRNPSSREKELVSTNIRMNLHFISLIPYGQPPSGTS